MLIVLRIEIKSAIYHTKLWVESVNSKTYFLDPPKEQYPLEKLAPFIFFHCPAKKSNYAFLKGIAEYECLECFGKQSKLQMLKSQQLYSIVWIITGILGGYDMS